MRARAVAGIAAGLLLLSLPVTPARAGGLTLQQAQAELKAINQRLQKERSMLARTQSSLSEQQATIASVHANLDTTTRQLNEDLNWEATLGRRVQKKRQQVASAQAVLRRDRSTVSTALVAIEQEGPGGYLDVVLGAQSFRDFETRVSMLGQIIAADVAVLGKVQRSEAQLAQAESQLAKEREQYSAAAKVQSKAQQALKQQVAYQRQAIAQLDASYAQQESDVHTDEGSSAEVQQIIQSLESSSGNGQGIGDIHFIWPVVGPITSPFGMRLDPITHTYSLHTGMDIGAPEGTPIHAAAAGKVIVAQYLNGYGYTIIIDDGDGVANLYAHQTRFAVGVGQEVQQGQVIGYVGMTGWATGPHLHFEVRLDGKPVNPAPYMPPMP